MQDRRIIFVPYQDSDNFYSDGILTREFAMLYLLWKSGYKSVVNVKKPRTILDRKHYTINEFFYPEGTIENQVKKILDKSKTFQYLPLLSVSQIKNKREWWEKGYLKIVEELKQSITDSSECVVYSDNPFAVLLLEILKKNGCKIYFDIMDNFAIHPSLTKKERMAALKAYKRILSFSDYVSANSQQTCEYMAKYSNKEIVLVKNGVFLQNNIKGDITCSQICEIRNKKRNFKRVVGYIGKIGKRLDDGLIDYVSRNTADTLFVFVGPLLNGQMNDTLINIFKTRDNVLHIGGIPSAYVYSMLDEFDILMIPHSVGKNENGGDPLKLYQYLTRNKPIITTGILGVDEFKDIIKITNEYDEWVKFISEPEFKQANHKECCYSWESRIKPIMEMVNK